MEKYCKKDMEDGKQKKILLVAACDITRSGVTVFLTRMLSNMDCSQFCINLYTPKQILNQSIADELLGLGIGIYTGGCKEGDPLRETAYQDLEQLMASRHYDVVHCNSGKVWINYFSCYFGVKYHVPKIIVHSHSALLPRMNPEVQKQDDEYREYIRSNATDFLACSDEAAEWLYGKDFAGYQIIENGIETKKYEFNERIRADYRRELNLENRFVIGHVGRFTQAKNHIFLLKVFKEISLICKNSILLMIGEGELLNDIKKQALETGIDEKCMFLGNRADVPELLNVMDIFLFPSLFEGFPISVLEAQTNGLPCIISEKITEEVCITKKVKRISLEQTTSYWAEAVMEQLHKNERRESPIKDIEQAGYSVQAASDKLHQLYMEENSIKE